VPFVLRVRLSWSLVHGLGTSKAPVKARRILRATDRVSSGIALRAVRSELLAHRDALSRSTYDGLISCPWRCRHRRRRAAKSRWLGKPDAAVAITPCVLVHTSSFANAMAASCIEFRSVRCRKGRHRNRPCAIATHLGKCERWHRSRTELPQPRTSASGIYSSKIEPFLLRSRELFGLTHRPRQLSTSSWMPCLLLWFANPARRLLGSEGLDSPHYVQASPCTQLSCETLSGTGEVAVLLPITVRDRASSSLCRAANPDYWPFKGR